MSVSVASAFSDKDLFRYIICDIVKFVKMAAGDIKNNLYRLQTELRHVRYPKDMDYASLSKGSPNEFVTILRYVMCDFSRPLAELILSSNVELTETSTNHKFMEGVYKVLRDQFEYIPKITLPQFFNTKCFAEHKILLTIDIVSLARRKHKKLRKPQARPPPGQECNKSTKKTPQLPDLPENFKPCHNSTLTSGTPTTSSPITSPNQSQSLPKQHENTPAVKIVVVGETQVPPRHEVEVSTDVSDAGSEKSLHVSDELDSRVTPRRQKRGGHGHGEGGLLTSASHHSAIRDSELKNHPVIRDLAITAGDLVNRVRTLEEQLDTLAITSRKSEQRRDAQILLLENKVKLLEAQITAAMSHPNDVMISNKRDPAIPRSPLSECEPDVSHYLETVVEEQDGDSVLVIDEGVGSCHDGSEGSNQESIGSESHGSEQKPAMSNWVSSGADDRLQEQAERIKMMLKDTECTLNLKSSLAGP